MSGKIAIIGAAVVLVAIGIILIRDKNSASDTERVPREQQPFTILTSQRLASMLENKDFFFVNVHVPYEGEIKNTDAFVPYDKIVENIDALPKDTNAKIVLYCRSGRMSDIAAKELVKLGYTNVSHLAGGMIEWEKNGYEILEK